MYKIVNTVVSDTHEVMQKAEEEEQQSSAVAVWVVNTNEKYGHLM